MASGNYVTLVGNVAREISLKFLPSGAAVAEFAIAVNRRWKNQSNEWEEQVSFFELACFGSLAENIGTSLEKGSRVVVVGNLRQDTWETKDGEKRHKIKVYADEVSPSLLWATVEVTRNERKGAGAHSSPVSEPPADYGQDEAPL